MARAEKVTAVAELTERFQTSAGAVLTEYRGLSVAQLGELRHSLGEHATFSVVKNTLTKIAATEAGVAGDLTEMLSGPSAIAFVRGDVVEAAKGLRDFSKANPFLVIKGGVLDGKMLTTAEIVKLADLESREVLLARLAGAMKASMAGAAATFAALPVQMARLLKALEDKRAAEAPAAEVQAAEAPAAETPSVELAAAADSAPAEAAPAQAAPAEVPEEPAAAAQAAGGESAEAASESAEAASESAEAASDNEEG
jgi:large subunit ribosomal protein L10